MQPYNISLNTNSTGLLYLFNLDNGLSGGIFIPLLLLGMWVIIFITGLTTIPYNKGARAFLFASFICAIMSIPLAVLNLIAPSYMYLLFVLAGFGMFWVRLTNSND